MAPEGLAIQGKKRKRGMVDLPDLTGCLTKQTNILSELWPTSSLLPALIILTKLTLFELSEI